MDRQTLREKFEKEKGKLWSFRVNQGVVINVEYTEWLEDELITQLDCFSCKYEERSHDKRPCKGCKYTKEKGHTNWQPKEDGE